MHWDSMFEDLESQLASEWEAERAALDAESERLRISKLELNSRLRVLCDRASAITLELTGGRALRAAARELGADWLAVAVNGEQGASIVPFDTLRGIRLDHGLLLSSLKPDIGAGPALRERMTLGFVLRDIARRRVAVIIHDRDGRTLTGTIDRAGADHLDLAEHDAGAPRRTRDVRGFRIVPFAAIERVRVVSMR